MIPSFKKFGNPYYGVVFGGDDGGGGSSTTSTTPSNPSVTDSTPTLTEAQKAAAKAEEEAKKAAEIKASQDAMVKAEVANITATPETLISSGVGQVDAEAPTVAAVTADAPTPITASTYDATQAAPQVAGVLNDLNAAQGQVSSESLAQAATMNPEDTGVKDIAAAQGEAVLLDNPVQREIQAGELVTGVADAERAAAFVSEVQAAQATPDVQATVKGQLDTLMQDFEGGNTPAWAAGAMRAATAKMAQRGLAASSMAGQAIVQAAMESALPIAAADAQTVAQYGLQNLSNRQQMAVLQAQQRAAFIGQEFDQAFQARVINATKISEVANMNFTAEQTIALENSRVANTMELNNLSNKQALVMAQAAAISQLESQNLSNVQQAAVQNAQAFLQMDMANLDNTQQTALFKAQALQQTILSDTAAENAATQFNASSENQTKQFMATLASQISQFNASQTQSADQFNQTVKNQRDMFNANNQLVIEQANAQWRQNIVTLNTASQNQANREYALAVNSITNSALAQSWQEESDMLSYAFAQSESAKDRANAIVLQKMAADGSKEAMVLKSQMETESALGAFAGNLAMKIAGI